MDVRVNDTIRRHGLTCCPTAPGSSSRATAAWSAPRWPAGSPPRATRCSPAPARNSICATPRAPRPSCARVRPDAVVLAAAKVGGIMANSTYPVQFLEDNLRIQLSVIAGAHAAGVAPAALPRLVLHLPQARPAADPRGRAATGPLEPTNEAYALAKIAGIVQIQSYRRQYGASYISAMPTNLYGPGDNFDLETSHVLPALIRRFHEARARRRGRGHAVGHRHPAPRVPARRRPGRGLRPAAAALRRRRAGQRRLRRGPDHPRTRRDRTRR